MASTCPVCGTPLSDEHGVACLMYEGVAFRFCSLDCLKVFQAFPLAYGRGEEPDLKTVEDSGF